LLAISAIAAGVLLIANNWTWVKSKYQEFADYLDSRFYTTFGGTKMTGGILVTVLLVLKI